MQETALSKVIQRGKSQHQITRVVVFGRLFVDFVTKQMSNFIMTTNLQTHLLAYRLVEAAEASLISE